ncbi:MAG TPA: PDZ domain-containing protein [Pirellulales bacterium]|nr:PDZ domain-containing protein [Pirellulales bacterium]
MKATMSRRWWACVAAAPLVCLAPSRDSAADEAPGSNPTPQNPAPAHEDPDVTVRVAELCLELWNATDLDLRVIRLPFHTDVIGADVAQVDDVLRSHLGLGEGKGLVVTAVAHGGPAAKAGVEKYDVLVTVGNQEIVAIDALRKALEASAHKPIALGFIRGGKKQSVEVTPRSATVARALASAVNEATADTKYWLGVGLAAADETLRSQLSLLVGGLVVTSVESDSPAAKAGVLVNDVLLSLDGRPLVAVHDLGQQLQEIANKPVSLELLRRGKPATLTVTPEKRAVASVHDLTFRVNDLAFPVYAPQQLRTWTTSAQMAHGLAFITAQANPDLAKQIGDLEAQVKQLEASLAALRASVEPPAQPAQSGEEKK